MFIIDFFHTKSYENCFGLFNDNIEEIMILGKFTGILKLEINIETLLIYIKFLLNY